MTEVELKVKSELDQVFRKNWGQMVAALTRILGTVRLDQAESLVQEAFVSALSVWAFRGIPDNPVGWLITSAKNKALDQLKHERVHTKKQDGIRMQLESWADQGEPGAGVALKTEVSDDLLRMMYVCCFPELAPEAQVALILKNLCGFSVTEIARGFLQKEKTVEQRLTRARSVLRDKNPAFEIPDPESITERTGVVYDAFYLLFNEGYAATEGAALIRRDLCADAIRLLDLVLEHPRSASPDGHALQALFCLQSSRFDARFDEAGGIVLFEDQDRSKWDQNLVQKGLWHLGQAMMATELSVFHLEAGIAAEYATSPSFSATNWKSVIRYYDALQVIKNNPVVALNRAVAVAHADPGPHGLDDLYRIEQAGSLAGYHLLFAAIAELERRRGHLDIAYSYFEKALASARTVPEQEFLRKRLAMIYN